MHTLSLSPRAWPATLTPYGAGVSPKPPAAFSRRKRAVFGLVDRQPSLQARSIELVAAAGPGC